MLRSEADFWLVHGRYILDIEIAIALVYYLKSLQGRYSYEVGMTSCLYQAATFGTRLVLLRLITGWLLVYEFHCCT
jgi:hypothetical protein